MEGGKQSMTIQCRKCKKDIPISATSEQIQKWQSGMLIQKAMPNVPAGEREMFITQICDSCFKAMFAGDEEE
jgi:hypothetical protein